MNWTKVEDQLPQPFCSVLVWVTDADEKLESDTKEMAEIGVYNDADTRWQVCFAGDDVVVQVSHWAYTESPNVSNTGPQSPLVEINNERPLVETNNERLREILKHIGDAAIELAIMRHNLDSEDYTPDDYPDAADETDAWKTFVEGIKADVVGVLVGDETGCMDIDELNAANCEMIWLREFLAPAQTEARDRKWIDLEAGRINDVQITPAYVLYERVEPQPEAPAYVETDNQPQD
jgi:hypothetical protein